MIDWWKINLDPGKRTQCDLIKVLKDIEKVGGISGQKN